MAHLPSRITVDTAAIPFRVLDLLGRSTSDLPGPWTHVGGAAEQAPESRWCFRGSGQADGQAIAITVVVRAHENRIWAVGVHCEPYLLRLGGEEDRKWLVAVPRPATVPAETVNWIALGTDGPYDLGVAA